MMIEFDDPPLSEDELEEHAENLRRVARLRPESMALLIRHGADFRDDESLIEAWRQSVLETLVNTRQRREEFAAFLASGIAELSDPTVKRLSAYMRESFRINADIIAEQRAEFHRLRREQPHAPSKRPLH